MDFELMDKKQYVHTIFSSIAKRYDFLNSLLSLKFDKRWRAFAVKVSELEPESKVLDVCTGTGELALAYAKTLRNGTRVIGTDFCNEMLIVGKAKVEEQGTADNFLPIVADTLNLPFADNSFDVVSVGFGMRNVIDLKKGIQEMMRVATPGGRVVILEFSQPENPVFKSIYYLYFKNILPLIGNIISNNNDDAYGYLPSSVMKFPNRRRLKEIMEECGLKNVKIYAKTFGIVTIHLGHKQSRGEAFLEDDMFALHSNVK